MPSFEGVSQKQRSCGETFWRQAAFGAVAISILVFSMVYKSDSSPLSTIQVHGQATLYLERNCGTRTYASREKNCTDRASEGGISPRRGDAACLDIAESCKSSCFRNQGGRASLDGWSRASAQMR